MKKNSFFTLVELLIVIGIIIILAGILLPVTSGALKKADQTKALSMAKTLENAFKMYRNDYGYFPSSSTSGQVTSTEYENVIKALQGDNQKKTRYLEIQGNVKGEYTDPWDNPFEIYFDHDYNGEISINLPGVKDKNGVIAKMYYPVVVYSMGPDGEKGTQTKDLDNVYSFPTTMDKKGKTQVLSK